MSARIDFAVFLAIIAATLGVAVAVGPAPAARADEIVVVHGDPHPYWHRHPPYYYPHYYRHPHREVVIVEPPPPPVVVEQAPPAAVVPAVPLAQTAAAPESYCREYQSTAKVDGKPAPSYGKACRQPDGSWKIVSQNP